MYACMYVCIYVCVMYCMQNVNGFSARLSVHKIWSPLVCLKCDQSFGQQKKQFFARSLYVCVCVCVCECASVYPALLSNLKLNNASFLRLNLVWIIWFCFIFYVFFFLSFFSLCFALAFGLINRLPPLCPALSLGREKPVLFIYLFFLFFFFGWNCGLSAAYFISSSLALTCDLIVALCRRIDRSKDRKRERKTGKR